MSKKYEVPYSFTHCRSHQKGALAINLRQIVVVYAKLGEE